ncbi:MAG: endonuclease/exonuclease/phosphatase family protein [Vulcanimicrobiota bacterium]
MRCATGEDGEFNWEHRQDRVFALLRKTAADVIALQEVLPKQRQDLEQNLSHYHWYGRGRNFGGGGEQCTIGVAPHLQVKNQGTFWLGSDPRLEGTVGWDACLPRICTWIELDPPGLLVANTHFDHLGAAARLHSAELLVSRFGSGPTVILGDFNATPTDPPLQILSKSFQDTLNWSEQPTYHEFGTLQDGPRIDYILTSPGLTVQHSEIIPEPQPYCSDHFAVQALI